MTPKELRDRLGLTQIQTALRCGVSPRTWQSWEAAGDIPKSKRAKVIPHLMPTPVERGRLDLGLPAQPSNPDNAKGKDKDNAKGEAPTQAPTQAPTLAPSPEPEPPPPPAPKPTSTGFPTHPNPDWVVVRKGPDYMPMCPELGAYSSNPDGTRTVWLEGAWWVIDRSKLPSEIEDEALERLWAGKLPDFD